ncbi:progestin and adipoQ receptor family member 3-like [Culicoides brevitarsis]|uniref:progestin and adipoQ receptor family member 3-like n=1 Tax=Culicoides brevitarsis TaxID=469753 RepID=UPI00307B5D0B
MKKIILLKKPVKPQEEKEITYKTHLCSYENAPIHLKFNPYILNGYRSKLTIKLCLESIFWWTNETINIWTHLFGCIYFAVLSYADMKFLSVHADLMDYLIIIGCLFCFEICLISSTIYHTFSCRSSNVYECLLTFDLFGIALSLFAIFTSGIYYAFWTENETRNFYMCTVAILFTIAMIVQIPRLDIHNNIKMLSLISWAVFGIVPAFHWYLKMGGFENKMVELFIPRIIGIYIISGLAFVIYMARIPERWFAGKMDFLGHSHNLWHILVLITFNYWHNTGVMYAVFMLDRGCIDDRDKCYLLT